MDIENFENGVNQYLDRGVFDPNFENAHNEFLGKRFYVDQSYKLNKSDTLKSYKLKAYNSILFEEKQYHKFPILMLKYSISFTKLLLGKN